MNKILYFVLLSLIFTTSLYFADSTMKPFVTIAPSGSYFEINGKPLILDGYNEQIVSSNLIGLWTNTKFARALEFAGILNFKPHADYKVKTVPVKVGYTFQEREIQVLSSQMKQA